MRHDSAAHLESHLLEQCPPALAALGLPHESVCPDYERSIGNLPATLAALLGAQLPGCLPPLPGDMWRDLAPGLRRIVWVILDALGWVHFQRLLQQDGRLVFGRLAGNGRLVPLTSVFPSTTTSALASLWTGCAPAQHGLVGHEIYLRQYGLVMDALKFSPSGEAKRGLMLERGLVPEELLPVPGLAQLLAEQGVVTRVLISARLLDSGLSRICFRGVTQVCDLITSADMWVQLRQLVAAHLDERLLLVGYWGDVDEISHHRGPDSESWYAELRNLAFSLEREFLSALSAAERRGTLLVIAADHGQLGGGLEAIVRLQEHPELRDYLLLPPSGGPRAAYLFTRHGFAEATRAYIQAHLSQQLAALDSGQALAAGLLGPGRPAPETDHRVGDVLVLGRDRHVFRHREPKFQVRGVHGGLSASEMLVPLLMARLD